MRSFEDRKAEILRRSEKRIKQRIRVLAACIPLTLCVSVCAMLTIPGMGSGELAEDLYGDIEMETHSQSSREICLSITDEAQAAQVREIIDGLYDHSVAIPDSDLEFTMTENNSKTDPDQYIILFPDENGEAVEYSLTGSRLVDRRTGAEYALSYEQLMELKAVLGIS